MLGAEVLKRRGVSVLGAPSRGNARNARLNRGALGFAVLCKQICDRSRRGIGKREWSNGIGGGGGDRHARRVFARAP